MKKRKHVIIFIISILVIGIGATVVGTATTLTGVITGVEALAVGAAATATIPFIAIGASMAGLAYLIAYHMDQKVKIA